MKKKHKKTTPAKINVNSLYEFFNVYNLFRNNSNKNKHMEESLTYYKNIKLHIIANECNHVVPIHSKQK